MPESSEFGELLVRHLDRIRASVRVLCRSSGINESDVEDCCSWVVMRFVEDDYAILRKFEGRSLMATYLSVVVARLVRDWRNERWGRWRPSAEAKRLGGVACQLERLVYRDGQTLTHAIAVIRSSLGAQAPAERVLIALFARIPRRQPLRPRQAGEEELVASSSREDADRTVNRDDHDHEWQRILEAIRVSLGRLNAQDRVVAQMRLFDGLSVAEIARSLAIEQKPLYRRILQIMAQLRTELERLGFSRDRLRDFLDGGVS